MNHRRVVQKIAEQANQRKVQKAGQQATPPETDSPIEQLVETARECGTKDRYAGKRQWARFKSAERLEVATAPDDPKSYLAVVMHNVSSGGCGFWSRRRFEPGSLLYLRRFKTGEAGPWAMARVRHCTFGIRGFLTGLVFEESCPSNPT